MAKKRYKKRKVYGALPKKILLSLLVIVLVACAAVLGVKNLPAVTDKTYATSSETSSESPQEVKRIATATVLNTGDLLMHNPLLKSALDSESGTYDFSDIFTEVSPYFKSADLTVVNLECTLGGTESGAYSGYPNFNVPDELIDNLTDAGVGLLLTANNHSYDTRLFGLKRTVQVLKSKGVPYIGTRENADEARYTVKDVNGIKIGMACFTYENQCDTAGRKSINGVMIAQEANDLLSTFSYQNIDAFYAEAESMISAMKKDGADCTVFYMHWGEEYQLKQNSKQTEIAQRLCDMGVDVIVGGHPHVVQPVELLTSQDGSKKTVCLYSLGNAVSNQRRDLISACPKGHSEDGMLFYYTFDKYSDGTTVLSGVDIIPTWVSKTKNGSTYDYKIYPIESETDAKAKYSGTNLDNLIDSYERTAATVSGGLTQCQSYLDCNIRFVNATPEE